MIRMMAGDAPERVALAENIWPDTLRGWTAQGYPLDAQGKPVDPASHFGFDMAGAPLRIDLMPNPGPPEVLDESEEWIVRRNGAGAALRYWKRKSGTPEHIDFRMTSRAAWERDYRPLLLGVDRRRLNIETSRDALARRRASGRWALAGQMFVWELMRQSMGDVCMYESLALDPAWIHDYNRVYTDFYKAHWSVLLDEAGAPDGFRMCEDLGYRNGLFCSPRMLETLIFPYYREIVDFFHSRGVPVFLHSCGGVEQALPLILEAGFDGLDPMEVKAGCDPVRFAEKTECRLVLRGGLDERILETGDRALIRREVARLIQDMKSIGARYVFGSDHSISTNVAYADYLYAVEVYRECMMY